MTITIPRRRISD
nr:TPA_asm: m13.5 sORF 3 [Murid betaherpesvirus 1]DBA07923.1 TPA_asm: m13.5 sORF 3 [Murid betaherpesvirus 1]